MTTTYEKIFAAYSEYKTYFLASIEKLQPNVSQNAKKADAGAGYGQSLNDLELLKTNLPTFASGYEAWRLFNDMLVTSTHTNNSFQTWINSITYLKSKIGGEAERLLSHFGMNEGNFSKESNMSNENFVIGGELGNSMKRILDMKHEANQILQFQNIDTWSWSDLCIVLCRIRATSAKCVTSIADWIVQLHTFVTQKRQVPSEPNPDDDSPSQAQLPPEIQST